MTAEFPGVLRDLFKLSLEQAQRVFETFITTSEGTWRGIRAGSQTGAGMGALMDKVAEITRANAEASFSFALKLAESEETNQAMKVCEEYARKQMEAFARQFEEMRDPVDALVATDDYLTGNFGQQRLPQPQPRINELPLSLAIVNFPD